MNFTCFIKFIVQKNYQLNCPADFSEWTHNYNYEKGAYSEISFVWNDKTRKLTIGKRKGDYPGMIDRRRFRIELIEPGNTNEVRSVNYSGEEIILHL